MERIGKFYIDGDRRRELISQLKQKGFGKSLLRRRLYSDGVLITYGLERKNEDGHLLTRTRVSVRADDLENAMGVINMLKDYEQRFSYSDLTTTTVAA